MKVSRRYFVHLAGGAAATPLWVRSARALDYPTRPIRIIVGFPAASSSDIVIRLLSQPLSERLGQQVIIDNRPGAGSNIGAEAVIRSAPDGYTLLAMTITNAVNATLYENLNFDILRDITPIVGTFKSPLVLVVTPSLPVKSVPELIAYAKANPGKINYASFGYGSAPNVNGELFKMMAGVNLLHVPYRGDAVPDLLAGRVQALFGTMPSVISFIRSGQLRALAVTSAKRSDALPEIPALAEFVPGFDTYLWHGIIGPKDLPGTIVDKLNAETNAALADPQIKAKFADLGGAALGGTPADLRNLIADEVAKWAKVIRAANIKPE